MARGATSRSQRLSQTQSQSQSASQPSQTQKRARRSRVEEEEEEDLADEMDLDDDVEGGGDGDDLRRKAEGLVRLALFCEQKRLPLKREEISKKVLGSKSRRFNEVLATAQGILRDTFGMEMVELQQHVEEREQRPVAETGKKRAAPTGTKSWILRSTLDPAIISAATKPDADILVVENQGYGPNDDMEDISEGLPPHTGAILAWQESEQLGLSGILYVVLALILVHGKAILENDLRALLRRLRLNGTGEIPLTSQATHPSTTLDALLTQFIRQGYLERERVGEGKAAKKKRGRTQVGTQGAAGHEDEVWEWRWGPRAAAEVGEQAMAEFVANFMVVVAPRNEDVGSDDERDPAKVEEDMKKMVNDIKKAAGNTLADVV